jgi:hypothetical protein
LARIKDFLSFEPLADIGIVSISEMAPAVLRGRFLECATHALDLIYNSTAGTAFTLQGNACLL